MAIIVHYKSKNGNIVITLRTILAGVTMALLLYKFKCVLLTLTPMLYVLFKKLILGGNVQNY